MYDAVDAKHAFSYLKSGESIGKIILNLPEDPNTLKASTVAQPMTFKQNSAYLLVGGTGGLGRSLATWLVERGARHLVFLSRSAGTTSTDGALTREFEEMGCSVTLVRGSVNNIQDIEEAIRMSQVPMKGVFHLAMVQRVSIPPFPSATPKYLGLYA